MKAKTKDEWVMAVNKVHEYKYVGDNVLHSGGNTELFTRDILELDKEYDDE